MSYRLKFAANPGIWGNQLRAAITLPEQGTAFHLTISEVAVANPAQVVAEERFLNLSLTPGDSRFITSVLAQQSEQQAETIRIQQEQNRKLEERLAALAALLSSKSSSIRTGQ